MSRSVPWRCRARTRIRIGIPPTKEYAGSLDASFCSFAPIGYNRPLISNPKRINALGVTMSESASGSRDIDSVFKEGVSEGKAHVLAPFCAHS